VLSDTHVLADSHVHLEQYARDQQAGLIHRAQAAGVREMLAVSLSLASSRRTLELAGAWPGVHAAIGVHPKRLRRHSARSLERLTRHAAVRAIGEVGLEYAPGAAPPGVQRAFLGECLDLAQTLGLAVVLHVVGEAAHADAAGLLRGRSASRVIVHYFVGGERLASQYLEAGCAVSVGKPVGRAENAELRATVCLIPSERLLLETDAYPLPGRATEPCDLVEVCRVVAAVRGETPEAVARTTTANFRRLLGLEPGYPVRPCSQ
jgi:TatD DNase family protein